MIRKGFISLVLIVCFCATARGQTFTFECLGEYISGAECPECTGQTTARLFNGLMIKRSGAYFKNVDCPYIVKQQGNNLVFQEVLNPNPETVTINLLSTGFSTMTGFRDSTACMCARQDSSWIGGGGDPSITNEGILGVAAGGSNDALLTSNTSGANGVTYSGSTTVLVTESTSSNGGTITLQADTSLIATVNDINAINCRWCSVKHAMPFYSNNPQTAFEALRTYWASRMGEIVVDTTVLLTANTTVAAAVRFVGGGNINVSSTFTVIFQSSVEAEPKLHIFTGDGTYSFNQKSVDVLYPYWFGALGNNSADDTDEIQKCVDAAISSEINTVKFLSGIHLISKGIVIRNGSTQVALNIEGRPNYDSDLGTTIVCTHNDNFAFGIQGSRRAAIKNMYIQGAGSSYNPTLAQVINNTTAEWATQYGRNDRYSPFSAIVIDPFKTTAPSGGGYPGFSAQYSNSHFSSSHVIIENVTARYFIVGIMVSPSGTNQNGSEVTIKDCSIQRCQFGIATGSTQARAIDVMNGYIATVAACFDGVTFGAQSCPMPNVIGGTLSACKDIIRHPARFGEGRLTAVYGESIYRIGLWSGINGAPLKITNCELKFCTDDETGIPDAASVLDAVDNKVYISGGSLTYSTQRPVEMNVRELILKGAYLERFILNNPNLGGSNETRITYEGSNIQGYSSAFNQKTGEQIIDGLDLNSVYGALTVPGQKISWYEASTTYRNAAVCENTNDAQDHMVNIDTDTITVDTTARTATFTTNRTYRYRVGDILFSYQNTSSATPGAVSKASSFGIVTNITSTTITCSHIPRGISGGIRVIYLWNESIFTGTYLANITSGSNKCVIVSKNTGSPAISSVWPVGTRVFAKTNQGINSGLYTGIYVSSVTADTLFLSGVVGSTVSSLEIFNADMRCEYHSYDNTYQTGASASRTVGYQTGDIIYFASHSYRHSAVVTAGGFTPAVKFLYKKLTGVSASKPTPESTDAGLTYYSTDTDILEIWDGTAWNPASADNSTTNEIETFVNTSDATSHTVTLAPGGTSVQLIEGANVTLTTGGTAANGTVTIAAASAAGTDLIYTGATSPVTLNSSTGTDVTITEGAGISLAATGTNLTITNSGDLSATNEAWTIDADAGATELINSQTVLFSGAGINTTNYDAGANTLTITGTEVDGSITNENLTISDGTDSENMGGQTLTVAATGIATVDYVPGTNTLSIGAVEVDGSVTNEAWTIDGDAGDTEVISNQTVLISGAGINATSYNAAGNTLTITGTEVDGSTTNEAWTIDADDADTEVISNQTVKFQGGGINVTDYIPGTDILTITGTEVDGSTTNELQTITNSSDATSHTVTLSNSGGSVQLIEGSNITLTTGGTASAGTVTIAATGGGTNYQTIRDDGADETQRAALNFVSTSTVNAVGTDDAVNNETEIALNIPTDGITATEIAAGAVGTSEIATNSVANADFRQSAALSVVGNATNATADVADISAASDGQVLRRSGTTLGFGALSLTSTGTVSGLTPQQVLYGGASGQVAQSANLTFNGTNLALGAVTPVSMIEAPSSSTNSTLKIGKAEVQSFTGSDANVLYTSNAYFNSSWTRRDAGYAGALQLYNGTFLFNTSETSSTAGSTFTPRTIMTGSTAGYVNVGNIAAGTIAVPLGVRGFGATSSTGAFHVQNSTPATILYCRDDQTVGIRTSSPLYALDVTSSSTASQLHFSGTGSDNGGYLVSAGASNFFMAAGASWNGSSWVAKATSASIIGGGATAGQLTFYTNTGLTIGNTFTVTERAKIDEDGDFVVGVSTAAARVHSKSAGSTSATYSGLFENSSGTDALTIRDDTKVGVATATPNRTLEVSGEVRITDLVTDTPTKIVGADADGDLDTIGINGYNELHITNGALGTNFHTTISPATLTTVTNNWNPTGLATAWIIELSGNGSFVLLTGITAPTFNKSLTLYNNGDNSILLPREFPTSTAANRFAFEMVLFPGKQIEIRYSVSEARWLLKSKAGAYEDVQEFYANHLFQSPVSITTGDFDFWEIDSEAAASVVAPTSNAWSGVSVNTSTSAGGLGYVSSKEPFFQTDNSSGSATWAYCKAVIRTPASLSDGTNDYSIRVGLNAANGGGGATSGMYFSYNHSLVSGNWGTATTNSGSTQMNNSGVAVTTNTTYILEVYVQPSLAVSFFINGVRVATNDTFVNTGDDMYAIAEIEKSVGTTQRDLIIYTLQASAAFVNNP